MTAVREERMERDKSSHLILTSEGKSERGEKGTFNPPNL